MKRIGIALLLLIAAPIAYATKTVPGYEEQNIIPGDVWRIDIVRATCQDPGSPPPPARACVMIVYHYRIRDENNTVRREDEYRKELIGQALVKMGALLDGDLPEINASEGL